MSIKKTKWYRRLRNELKSGKIGQETFDECIKIASQKSLEVIVYLTDETGENLWAISADEGFWLGVAKTKEKAIETCRECEWEIKED